MSTTLLDRLLYPPIEPLKTGFIAPDSTHNIYWEVSGNPAGRPVIVLHGGPGGGSSAGVRRFFDPEHYMIIQYDQRGCGQSTPLACLENNTTEYLVSDISLIADHLDIKEFHLFGGSWGSTLALAYAETHPERCLSLTLRGIFLMRQSEIDWFMTQMGAFFPEAYDAFSDAFPETPEDQLLESFYAALTGDDPAAKGRAAIAWSRFEASCCTLIPDKGLIDSCNDPEGTLPISLLEAHYFIHNKFDPDDALLRNVDRIQNIPATLVQGRYDIICPPRTAWELKKHWPNAHLEMIADAGHSSREPGIAKALLESMERFKVI
jgi:proline iminopeptidase